MALLNKEAEVAAEVTIVTDEIVEHIDTTIPFEDHINRFKKQINSSRKRNIKILWEMGSFVKLLKDEKVYGEKTVETFVEEMGDAVVSKSEAYKWAQFAERYTADDVNRILNMNNMSWAVVSNLIRVKSQDIRLMLEESIDKGEIKPSQVQEVVSNIRKEEEADGEENKTPDLKKAVENTNVNNCRASFKKVNIYINKILTLKENCAKDINDLGAILDDEEKYEKAVDVMDEFRNGLLPQLKKVLEELEHALNQTI